MFMPAVKIFRAFCILLVAMGVAAPASAMERLPRAQFDVIAPSSRIIGTRGDMRVYQGACRVGPTHWARRRIVDIAVQEWGVFGFQIIDATKAQTRVLPDGLIPDAVNPLRAARAHYPSRAQPWHF